MLVNFEKFSIDLDNIILIRHGKIDDEYGVLIVYKANNDARELMLPCQDWDAAERCYNRIMKIYYENKRDSK